MEIVAETYFESAGAAPSYNIPLLSRRDRIEFSAKLFSISRESGDLSRSAERVQSLTSLHRPVSPSGF